jgi:hypothetical protein
MAKLNNKEKKRLVEADFKAYPVWAWNDFEDAHCPIDDAGPLPTQYGNLFVSATYATSSVFEIPGYLIGCHGFYAYGLFVKGKSFVLNVNTPDFVKQHIDEISHLLGISSDDVFPLRYYSDVLSVDGKSINGTLEASRFFK